MDAEERATQIVAGCMTSTRGVLMADPNVLRDEIADAIREAEAEAIEFLEASGCYGDTLLERIKALVRYYEDLLDADERAESENDND